VPCPAEGCDHGTSLPLQWLRGMVEMLLLPAMHRPSRDQRRHPYWDSVPVPRGAPPAKLLELGAGLAGRGAAMPGMGHDGSDRWAATTRVLAAAGLPEDWACCEVCDGHGIDPAHVEAYEAWVETPIPEGPAYQLWETVSEGSPQSPTFETPRELADWLGANYRSRLYQQSAAQWLRFIEGPGWAPSGISGPDGFKTGVAYMVGED